jgi:murein DD-endopeptidase MepM/ murein hydrolase activator NlpD
MDGYNGRRLFKCASYSLDRRLVKLRMGKGHHTVIFVPHARAKLRKWRVTNLQLGIASATLVLLALASVFILVHYFTTDVDAAQVARLRQENENLRKVNESFESSIRSLQEKLTTYEDRTLQLAIVAGLDPGAGSGEAGVGGEPFFTTGRGDRADFVALEDRATRLDGSLDAIQNRLEERLRWISATPAIAPAKGIITSAFGRRRDPITGVPAFHEGVDIGAAPGQKVHAAADGIVVRAGRMGSLGKAVVISHGFGLTTRYGHMSRLVAQAGQKVKRGDVIGFVGSTGRSTGYHLHYEVQLDGKPVNPVAYILDGSSSPR